MQIDRKQARDLFIVWGRTGDQKTAFSVWMNSQLYYLSDKQFHAVSLMFEDELSIREIAVELNISCTAVKHRLTTAYDRLTNVPL